jgi:hypothetical protein
MQESNDVSKIGLMIAYEQHILPRQIPYMLRTPNTQFINDG